jgi:DNA-directed RNA polymerase subunit RPC12/RpoP
MTIDKICPVCSASFKDRENTKRPKITCSRNCSNRMFVRRKTNRPKTFSCIVCDKIVATRGGKTYNKYCSYTCARIGIKNTTEKRFENGEINQRHTLRKLLANKRGYKCNHCNISVWNKKPITLQVNHIDGNCTNNLPSNLELICPNCHSQTDTFGAKNKGNGRKSRGSPLHY